MGYMYLVSWFYLHNVAAANIMETFRWNDALSVFRWVYEIIECYLNIFTIEHLSYISISNHLLCQVVKNFKIITPIKWVCMDSQYCKIGTSTLRWCTKWHDRDRMWSACWKRKLTKYQNIFTHSLTSRGLVMKQNNNSLILLHPLYNVKSSPL
jgi:hypothetical protein